MKFIQRQKSVIVSSKNTVQKATCYPRLYNAFHHKFRLEENDFIIIIVIITYWPIVYFWHTVKSMNRDFPRTDCDPQQFLYDCRYITALLTKRKKVKGNQKELDWSHLSPRNVVCSPCWCSRKISWMSKMT